MVDNKSFIEILYHFSSYLDSHFPENELAGWNIFQFAALRNATSFNFGEVT